MRYTNCYIFTLAFMMLSAVSCSEREQNPQERFKQVYHIKATKLNVDTYKFNSFGKMLLYENESCIIKENIIGESLIDKLYYQQDSMFSLAKIGSGPDEYIMLRIMQKDSGSVLLLDIQKKQIIKKDISGKTIYSISLDCMPLTAVHAKNCYIVSGIMDHEYNHGQRYAVLNEQGEYQYAFGEFPNDGNDCNAQGKTLAYQNKMAYHPKLNRFATVCSSGAIFELYQVDTVPYLIKKYHDRFPRYKEENHAGYNRIKHEKNNIIGYNDIYATNKNIYTAYSGKKLMEHNNSGMMAAMLTTDILVYDWDGKCVCRFVSDIPLFNICVTDDDKQLMALGWEEDFHLYSFDLSQILDLVK